MQHRSANILICFFLISKLVFGQSNSLNEFNKNWNKAQPFFGTGLCGKIEIDKDKHPLAKKFIYKWSFGDEKTDTGLIVKHCYSSYKKYQIQLDLIARDNPELIFKNELNFELALIESDTLILNGADVNVGELIERNIKFSSSNKYKVNKAYWQFCDSIISSESIAIEPISGGAKELKVLVNINMPNGENVWVKKKAILNVLKPDINGISIVNQYKNQIVDSTNGRFLKDNIHLVLREKGSKEVQKIDLVEEKGYFLPVQCHKNYEMFTWKGNVYSEILSFSTSSCQSSDEAEDVLRQKVSELSKTELFQLESMKFDLDKVKFNKSVKRHLHNNFAQLKKHPYLDVLIGSYTHTGGNLSLNTKLAQKRSETLHKYLIKHHIEDGKIHVADNVNSPELINTCGSEKNCVVEDPSLNKRTEFKVIGIK